MAIYGNMVGSSGGILGKTIEIISDDGTDLMGVVVDQEQILDAKPSDVRIGKKVVTDDGVIEGTNTITYRTEMSSILVYPNDDFSIHLSNYDRYDYTKIQCIITLFNAEYDNKVSTKWITIGDSVYSIETSEKISDITKNTTTKSIDLNLTNDSDSIYEIFYFTYRDEI